MVPTVHQWFLQYISGSVTAVSLNMVPKVHQWFLQYISGSVAAEPLYALSPVTAEKCAFCECMVMSERFGFFGMQFYFLAIVHKVVCSESFL